MRKRFLKKYRVIGLVMLVALLAGGTVPAFAAETDAPAALSGDNATENGWVEKDGVWYYYIDGVAQTGWNLIKGYWYYMDSTGAMQTGWQKVNEKWYYMKSSGQMVTGWQCINTKWYYFASSGAMQTGWITTSGKWYYLSSSGAMVTGACKIDGKTYCFDGSGVMLKSGWHKVDGKWYYLQSSGAALTGWQKISGKWYYMDADGVMQTGWQNIEDEWYYLNASGAMVTGWHKSGDTWYYLSSSGAMVTGWEKIGGKWYLFDSSGKMLTGWQQVSGEKYYLTESGAMLAGGWQKIGGYWYLLHSSGKALTGWQKVNGEWYYMDKESAKMLTGWQEIDGKWYYLYEDGHMARNTYIGEYWVNDSGEWVPEENTSSENLVAIRKMFYAVETGGQEYGKCRYDAVTAAYANSANETAITIGAGQWFATEARDLLNLIRETDPDMFEELDTAGIAYDLDNADWKNYDIDPEGEKGQCIKAIIDTPVGRKCQDQMMDEQIQYYLETAENAGITELGGQVMYAETMHLGGKKAADRILGHCEKPYTADTYYVAVTTTWPEDAELNSPVTDYKTRHKKIYGWIKEYLK